MKYIHMPRLEYYKPFFNYIYTSKKSMIQQTIFSLSAKKRGCHHGSYGEGK